jgi:predicted GNAT family acetyltransferase
MVRLREESTMSDAAVPEVIDNPAAGRFEVRLNGEVAFAEYRQKDGYILFPHTVVPPAFEGKGVGGALVRHALAVAREQGQKIMPACSFFAAYIARHPEYQDLVHPDYRPTP